MPHITKHLKQFIIVCFIMLYSTLGSFAQMSRVNELLGQLSKDNPDTVQIRIMRKLSAAYTAVDPLKKFYYANQYKLLAEKNGIDSLVATAYLDMGISYGVRSNLDSALYYFNLGFEKSKAINYTMGIAKGHANIGYAYDLLERKRESVKHYEEALKIYKKLNLKKNINQAITNIGSLYFDLKEYKIADFYFQQVLSNVKTTPADKIGLGNALFSLGNSNRRLGNLKKSLAYYKESLAIRENIGDISGIALSNWGLGVLYNEKKDYNRALVYLQTALEKNSSLKNKYQEATILIGITNAYLGLKKYKNAEETAKLALSKAEESDSKNLKAQTLELLTKINTSQKDFEAALRFQSDYIALNDSIDLSKAKKDVIAGDLRRINSDNRNLEINNKLIASRNSDYIVVISIITFLLLIVAILLVLYYKRNQEKKSTNALLQKQKQEIADVNEELSALNEELTVQMDIVSTQNIELDKLNKVKNKFFSIVSHDLRSPLTTLKALFGLYRKGELNEAELNELLKRLEDTIYTTATFLDNLLEWAKSQLEGMVVQPSAVDISHIVADNIKLMESQIGFKELHVENNIAVNTMAFADPNMINTVFRNLLSNAVKFCHTKDSITFGAKIVEHKLVCSISDSGPGISKEDMENLFNLVHTVSTGTAGEKGYHIGLSLCKDMIVQNNGKIEIESELGKGTTFYITLPLP